MIIQLVGVKFMNKKIYLALYKGRKQGLKPHAILARFSDWLTRKLTRGPYSHCELAIKQEDGCYYCLSSSIRDGGVRSKVMPLPDEKWDLIQICISENTYRKIIEFFQQNKGKKYDFLGALGVVFKFKQSQNRYFCSEFVAEALGYEEAWRFSPNDLVAVLKSCSFVNI